MEKRELEKDTANISRKHFLSLTGKSMAIGATGTLMATGILQNDVLGQTSKMTTSPPASIPISH